MIISVAQDVIGQDITALLTTYGLPTTLALVFAYTLIKIVYRIMDENRERELRVVNEMTKVGDTFQQAFDRNTIAYNNVTLALQSLKDQIEHNLKSVT